MNAALDVAVTRLGMVLLHFVWQGALIGCFAAAGLALLRNARPQARYALCGGALLLCVLLPLGQLLVTPETGPVAPALAAPIHIDPAIAPAAPDRAVSWSLATLMPSLPVVVLLWGIGAALMSMRLMLGLAWVRRLGAAAAVRPIDPAWSARLAVLARRMGLRRLPGLRVVEGLAGLEGPATIGRWRPLILLPASLLAQLPVELVEALLAHELAHVRRLDYLANLLQSVVEVLLFYHPVVWWLSRRIRIEREQIADDLAAEALGEPRRLALALSELARFQSSPPPLALAAQGGSLMTRIRRLVRPIPQPLGAKLLLPLAGLAALAIAAHAAGVATPAAPATRAVPPTPTVNPAPAAPVARAAPSTITLGEANQPFAFALVSGQDGSTTMSGNEKDMRELKARRASLHGDFLWVRQGNQRYVVTDPGALAEVQALWAPVHAFDAEMDQLSHQVDAQSEVVQRLAQEAEAAHEAPSAELEALQERRSELHKQRDKAQAQVDKVARKMAAARGEKQRAQFEQQMEQLESALEPIDESIDAIEQQIERLEEAREQALEQTFAQQEQEADKAMEALSRQMEAIGQKQEAAAKIAEEQLRALLPDLVRRGLVKQG